MPASATVLIVEDEAALRAQIQRALKAEGYRVIPASDGRAAVENLRMVTSSPTTWKPRTISSR